MKKILSLILILSMVICPMAFAMQWETAQALYGGPQGYAQVTLASRETTIVSEGMLLAYDLNAATPRQGAYQVVVASQVTADTSYHPVAGFATGRIASGATGFVKTYGFGKIRYGWRSVAMASGDNLWPSADGTITNVSKEVLVNGGMGRLSQMPVAVLLQATSVLTSTHGKDAVAYGWIRIV